MGKIRSRNKVRLISCEIAERFRKDFMCNNHGKTFTIKDEKMLFKKKDSGNLHCLEKTEKRKNRPTI